MTEREASMIGRAIEGGLEELGKAIVVAAVKNHGCLHKWADARMSNAGGYQQTCEHCNEIRLIK